MYTFTRNQNQSLRNKAKRFILIELKKYLLGIKSKARVVKRLRGRNVVMTWQLIWLDVKIRPTIIKIYFTSHFNNDTNHNLAVN